MSTKVQRVYDLMNSGDSGVILYVTKLSLETDKHEFRFYGIPLLPSHKYNELAGNERLRLNILKQLGMGTSWCTRASRKPCKALFYLSQYDMLVTYRDNQPFTQAYFYDGYGSIKFGVSNDTNNKPHFSKIRKRDIPDAGQFIQRFFR